jgi:NADH-quinone oxidoreductase subunit M
MHETSNIIPILVLLPIAAALITLFAAPKHKPEVSGPIAFILSLIPLGIVAWMVYEFPMIRYYGTDARWYFNCRYDWIPNLGVKFMMGVDSISLWLVVLTAILTPVSILASFKYIKERQPEFYAWMLMLHAGMLGVFCAKDLLVFYLFFEFTLIPMFFIIGIWGGAERRKAAGKFFLFTFAGSVLTLAALLYISFLNMPFTHNIPSFAIDDLYAHSMKIPPNMQYILFLGLLAGFAVKVPLFPVHTWLPLAHTEAPTAGSVILAGVLLKLGTYGMLRFLVPVLPDATRLFAPWIAAICIIGIIYGALVSWVQGDMKKLIAYSSVSHLGFCVLGMFALTSEGLTGSVLYMINHGLSTGALFLVVGMIYERYHTRDMNQVGGIVRRVPALGFFAVFFVLSSIALPGLNGFVSEFLVLIGTFVSGRGHIVGGYQYGNLGPAFAIPAATGMILAAVYMLYWAGRVVFGPLKEPAHEHAHHEEDPHEQKGHQVVRDLSFREWAVLVPLAVLVIYLGVYPKFVINSLDKPVDKIANMLRLDASGAANPRVAQAGNTVKALAAAETKVNP